MLVIDVLKEKHSDAWVPIHPNWKITKWHQILSIWISPRRW
jgi:hypothetical protein